MPLEPQIKAILDQAAGAKAPPLSSMSPGQARDAFRSMLESFGGTPPAVAKSEDRAIDGPAGQIGLRVYTPEGNGPFPALVFFHGGGWVVGDLDSHDALCRALTNEARCITVAVDYRRAPENKFPAAAEDCYAATLWVAKNGASLNTHPAHLVVGGDSAGGNLAAAVSLMARDRAQPRICFQLLMYPALDSSLKSPSQTEFADGYLLTRADMAWFWGHYLAGDADRSNPYACQAAAEDLTGLPRAMVITAEFDTLRDEGEAYAQRLQQAKVPVIYTRFEGVTHGFMSMASFLDKGRKAISDAAAGLHAAFKG
ncbi:MAG: alpha/beta hydrolase [Candidatus Binataceae bacterium]